MKTINQIALLALLFLNGSTLQLSAQNLIIHRTEHGPAKPVSHSSFYVHGEVKGLDSGSIKLSWAKNVAYAPIRQGHFTFSGSVNSLQPVELQIMGDYYVNAFYAEPGSIDIKIEYQNSFTASGTKENDLSNYFFDTLAKEPLQQLWQLGQDVNSAMATQDLDRYLALVDSYKTVEQTYLAIVDTAISQKRFGHYLLAAINNYYISYSYFAKRIEQFAKLPEKIKNARGAQVIIASIRAREMKSRQTSNEMAYPFALKDMAGKVVSLSQYKGKVVVLDFWASWCAPCIKALPLLKKVQAHNMAEDVVFISVSIDKKAEDWRAAEKSLAIPWRSVLANPAMVAKYKVDAVPNYMGIDKIGRIVSRGASLSDLINFLQAMKGDAVSVETSAQQILAKTRVE